MIHDFSHNIGDKVYFNYIHNGHSVKSIVTISGIYVTDNEKWYLCHTNKNNAIKLGVVDTKLSLDGSVVFTAEPDELEPIYRELKLAVNN